MAKPTVIMEHISTAAWLNVAEIEITYRTKVKACDRPIVRQSSDAYQLFEHSWNENQIRLIEEFKIMLLNRANKVLGIVSISTGGMTGTVADPRLIFAAALKCGACGIMLCHNHPSENLKPSQADIDLTQKLVNGAKLLDIRILDHLVISPEGYFSFCDEGLL
jgi:DNA repair protein RadC